MESRTQNTLNEHLRQQPCYLLDIFNHSLAICQTSATTALPSARHLRPQHCHLLNIIDYNIAIRTL
jgi:hypothetical protein